MISDLMSAQQPTGILLKPKSDHVSALLKTLQQFPISLCVKAQVLTQPATPHRICSCSYYFAFPTFHSNNTGLLDVFSKTAIHLHQDLCTHCSSTQTALPSAICILVPSPPQAGMAHPIYNFPPQVLPVPFTCLIILYNKLSPSNLQYISLFSPGFVQNISSIKAKITSLFTTVFPHLQQCQDPCRCSLKSTLQISTF